MTLPPVQFDGPARGALKAALFDAFPGVLDIQQLLSDRLDKRLDRYTSPFLPVETQIFQILEKANAAAWIAQLVSAALDAVPKNPKLREFAFKYGFGSVGETELHDAQEAMVQKGQPFFDLAVWRAKLGMVEAAVGRFEVTTDQGDVVYGTAFLVGPSVCITNYHVLAPLYLGKAQSKNALVRFDYKRMADGTVNTGLTYGLAEAATWDLDHSTSFTPVSADPRPDRLDYALFRLAEPAGAQTVGKKSAAVGDPRGWLKPLASYGFAEGSPIFIVQHPQGDPLKMALAPDGVVSLDFGGARVRYKTNTMPGSSGSPCLTEGLDVVALHHAGDPNFEAPPQWNQGIPFEAILKLMDQRGTKSLLGT